METPLNIQVTNGGEKVMMYQHSHVKEFSDSFSSKGFLTVSNIWSMFTLIANIWTLFSVILWFSAKDHPQTGILFIEIVIECYLLFEVFARILIRVFASSYYESLQLHHIDKNDRYIVFALVIVGSAPIMSIFAGSQDPDAYEDHIIVFSRFLLLKLFRAFEIRRAFVRIGDGLFYKNFKLLVFFKFAKNLTYIIFITHLSTCGWLMVNILVNNDKAIEGTSSLNLLNQDEPYFTRNGETEMSLFKKYVDSAIWAVTTLTGCSFGDISPRTLQELIITNFVFVIGILLLAKIFSDFASVLHLFDLENLKIREKSLRALKLCKVLGLPSRIRYKVEAYYAGTNDAYSQIQHFPFLKDLPPTLFSEVALSLKQDLITRSNLFNFGTPTFVFTMTKYLYPKVSMAGDYVVRVGEYANEMFFIKKGEVEILSSDTETQLAILREGAYFGEVGVLLNDKRSVSVRALTLCTFEVIKRDDFKTVLEHYPKQKEYLLKVAHQRAAVCTTSDLELTDDTNDLHNSKNKTVSSAGFTNRGERLDSASNLTEKKSAFRPREINTPTSGTVGSAFKPARRLIWQKTISTFKEHACKSQGIDYGHLFIILPNSTFYRYWMVILQLAAFTSFFMVPYEIAFFKKKSEVTALWWFFDVLIVIIYFIDIFVHMNTSIPHRAGFISDKIVLHKRYIQKAFLMDFLAFLPVDYFLIGSHITWGIMDWVKVLRFLKIVRVLQLLYQNQKNGERKNQITTLALLIIFHTAANHICACIMYRIASSQPSPNMFTYLEANNKVDMPLTNETPFTIYIYFIYWAYSTSSLGAYGDIKAITSSEKIFQIFAVLFFRVYFAFCAAEGANLISNYYTARTENLAKQTTYEKWMKHVKLPGEIIQRVKSYNDYIWKKYRGLDENLILDDLPSTTRLEILEFLLNDLLYSVELFPKDEVGFFPTIIKDFRFVQITKGEYVFKSGELAEEVYFVIGGKISIIDEEHDQREMAVLTKNAFFGETAIVETDSPLRTKSARAKTDVSLASLHVSYVRDIWRKYPNVKTYMLKIAETKRGLFHKIDEELAKGTSSNRNEVKQEGDWILKDLDLHLKSQKESYREGRIKVLSEAELEFEKLREELADVLEPEPEPEQVGHESNTQRSDAGMLSMAKRDSESTFKFDPNSAGLKTVKSNPTNPNDISGISQVPHKSVHITSRFEFDDILNTIQNPEEENSGIIKHAIGLQTRSPRGKGFNSNIDEQMNECFLASQPVDQSIDIHQLAPTRQKSLPVKQRTFLEKCEDLFRKVKPFLMTVVVAFEWIFAPTNLALDFHDFSGAIMAVEVIFVFIWFANFLVEYKDYRVQKRKRGRIVPLLTVSPLLRKDTVLSTKGDEEDDDKPAGPKKHQPWQDLAFLFLNFLYILPFQMIFKRADVSNRMTNFFLIVLQLIRLFSVNTLYLPFKLEFFKRKYALANILMALYVYVLANHIFACFWILIGKSKTNFNYTWFAKLPAPNFDYPNNYRTTLDVDHFTIYTSALYWSYVTTSHVGVGDVVGINALEKGYSTIIIMLSTFLYAFLFGNLASLVDDMKPRFQKQFEENYRKALEYTKNAKIEAFLYKIHTYYAYIWQSSRGIDENALMKDLPSSLKYDIFLNIYREIIDKSKLFKNENGLFDPRVFYYLCKAFTVKIYMRNDFIVISGQEVKNVYLILEGAAEVVDYSVSLKGSKQLHPGDYFGGVFLNMPQVEDIMATDMTKVAVIPQEVLFRLKGAFPGWYAGLIKHEEIYKLGQRFLTNVRKMIQQRKENPKTETSPAKSPYLRVGAADFRIKSLIPKSDLSLIDSESSEDSSSIEPKLPKLQMNQVHSPSHEPLKGNLSPDENEEPRMMSPLNEELQFSNKTRPLYRLGKPIMISTDNRPQKLSQFGSKAGGEASPLTKEGSPSKRFRFFKKSAGDPDPEELKSPAQAKKSGFSFFRPKPSKELNIDLPSPNGGLSSKREQMRNEHGLKIEVVHAMGRQSEAMSPSRFQRFMSVLRLPSFLVQDEEPSTIIHNVPGRSTPLSGTTRKALKKVNLKRTSTYGPKNFTNNFIHLIGLRKKHHEQMKHLKYYIDPNSGWRTCYELLYTSIAIYSLFVVPVFVGFGTVLGPYFTALEILILIGQVLYLVLLMRTAQYHQGVLSLDSKMIWRKLWWEKGIFLDLIATIPFNLIFSFTKPESVPLLIGILKLNRVLLLPKVPPQLEMFSAKYPNFAVYFTILKPVFYLIFGSHLIACLFSFSLLVEPTEYYSLNFAEYLELDLTNKGRRYLVCLTFFLNIATTTGFPEFLIYNNYERCIFIICIYLGDALFALVMGWVASSSSTLPRKFNDVFNPLMQVESVLEEGGISKKIKKKVEGYFHFMVESKSRNVSCIQFLDGVLPETMLKDMHYAQAHVFHNFPLLQAFKTEKTLIHEIVKNIKHSVYLPHDYIISRGDDGSSVFCIESGTVHMLSPTEKKVIAILKAGQIFGEMGAYTLTRHLAPYVAASYCLIYTLDKETLKKVLKTFPHANFEYKLFAKERLDDSTKFFVGSREIYEKVFKHLQNIKHTATDKEEIQELLETSEVPHFMLVDPRKLIKNKTKSGDHLVSPADFGSPFLNDYIEQNKNEISFDQSIDQYVEDNELLFRTAETNKESLRVKSVSKERRFSRVKMGGKKSGSKHHAVTIRWGVTIH